MATGYSLVLLGRFPGRDRVVSQTLARTFSRDDNWGLQVVAAAPIVILDNLSQDQALAVHQALEEVEAVGSRFEVQDGLDSSLPKVSWPTPAQIRGRPVTEFVGAGDSTTIVVPCPYTGQKIAITIKITVSAVDGSVAVSAGAAAAASGTAIPSPTGSNHSMATATAAMAARPLSAPIAIPVPAATKSGRTNASPISPIRATPPQGVPIPKATPAPQTNASRTTPPPVAPVANAGQAQLASMLGLDDLDELTPMEQIPAPNAAQSKPIEVPAPNRAPMRKVPMPSRPPSGSAPLPDVPVIHGPPVAGVSAEQGSRQFSDSAPMPQDLMASPMDLSAFEANVNASGIHAAATAEVEEIGEAEPAESGDGNCAVYISKSINPKVHQIVAEVKGIPAKEAARLCQSPNVLLAKDLSENMAEEIKARFAGFNVNARVTQN